MVNGSRTSGVVAFVVVACLGGLSVGACGGDSVDEPQRPSAPPTGISSARYVTTEMGAIQSITPDGRSLLVADESVVCLQSISEGSTRCTDWPARQASDRVPVLLVDWTPDGSKAGLVDAAAGSPPTIWLLDAVDMSLEAWLEPGDDDRWIILDVAIAPDGDRLAIAGVINGTNGFFVLDSPGDLEHIGGDAIDVEGDAIGVGVAWLPDGEVVAIEMSGAFSVVQSDGGGSREILSGDQTNESVVAGITPDSGHLLIVHYGLIQRFKSNESWYAIADVGAATADPVVGSAFEPFDGPYQAALSPDGSWVAYVFDQGADRDRLTMAVRATTGGDETILTEGLDLLAGEPPDWDIRSTQRMATAVWGTDDQFVMISASCRWVLVIQINRQLATAAPAPPRYP